ncbi:MAG: hypothetical protein CL685_02595 [Candidatus Magasanikbacteria bacterium]|nr:hypothetical protein [Candidatus Magasanikbacteria bacterium]
MDALVRLIMVLIPEDLRSWVIKTLMVPQFGPYHKEGSFLWNHLELAMKTIEDVGEGVIDARIPKAVKEIMVEAVNCVGIEFCQKYVLLHDFDKGSRLSLKLSSCSPLRTVEGKKGTMLQVSWDEWVTMFTGTAGEELDRFCKENGIIQISYYHQNPTDDLPGKHGACTAERFKDREDISEVLKYIVATHENSKDYSSVDIGRAFKLFNCDDLVAGLILVCNYADQMASLRENGEPDLTNFINFSFSFLALRKFELLCGQLGKHELFLSVHEKEMKKRGPYTTYGSRTRNSVYDGLTPFSQRLDLPNHLDELKLADMVRSLKNAKDAFREETVQEACDRIIKACQLQLRSKEDVCAVLSGIALPEEVLMMVVEDMGNLGILSQETGRGLGRYNKDVRKALKKLK